MFNDTISLSTPASFGNDHYDLSLTDVTVGKSLRKIILDPTLRYEFSVGNVASTENSPLKTTRVVVRVDVIKFDNVVLKEIKSSSYIVFTSPSGDVTTLETVSIMFALIQFLFNPNLDGSSFDPSAVVGPTYANLTTTVSRLLTGEL
jgi:hypothetical protein